jgi:hypothetical protein
MRLNILSACSDRASVAAAGGEEAERTASIPLAALRRSNTCSAAWRVDCA